MKVALSTNFKHSRNTSVIELSLFSKQRHPLHFLFLNLFKIIIYWLCYYSCPNFSPFALLHPVPPLPQGIPASCPWVMCISSLATPCPVLYFTSPWLFCNYLFILLNPLTSSPIPPHPPPFWQPSKCSLYP